MSYTAYLMHIQHSSNVVAVLSHPFLKIRVCAQDGAYVRYHAFKTFRHRESLNSKPTITTVVYRIHVVARRRSARASR